MTNIFDRTHFQSRNQLQKILDGAAAVGELDQLYWFVEAKLPGTMTTTKRPQLQAASWPGKWIPVVAVGADPVASRHWIDLLVACFKASNRSVEFGLGLTAADLLQRYQCYEWGDVCWDNVCVVCGAVEVASTVGSELCGRCAERMGLVKVVCDA